MPAAGARSARANPANLADRAAPRRRPGRRRAARTRTRGSRCAVGLSGPKSRFRSGRPAAPLCSRAARLPPGPAPADGPAMPPPSRSASWYEASMTTPRPFSKSPTTHPIPSGWPASSSLTDSTPVEDLGRGLRLLPVSQADGRNLVLDLLPHGVAAIRIAAPRVRFSSVKSYPSDAVRTAMRTRFNELSAQLARLNHGLSTARAEPANPGFEPNPTLNRSSAAGSDSKTASPDGAEPRGGPFRPCRLAGRGADARRQTPSRSIGKTRTRARGA